MDTTDIHWRKALPPGEPREPFMQITLTSLLLWVGFSGALLGIYRVLGLCFGFFPLLAVSWLFLGWRWDARGSKLWLVPGLCVFPAILLWSAQYRNPLASQHFCQHNLKQIGLAIANYNGTYRTNVPLQTFDADGYPLHSWRTLVLPYMERERVYKQVNFSEPWDSPKNRAVRDDSTYPVWRCPSEPEESNADWTNYLAIVHARGNTSDKRVRWNGFKKGTGNTAMLAEVSNSGIHWMEPRDLHVTQMAPYLNGPPGQGPSSQHGRGVNVLFTDGRVDTISLDADPAVVRQILTGESRKPVPTGSSPKPDAQ